jgi:nickel/cobalt exporter
MRFIVAALAAVLLLPATASAHPLGNFSVNHQARISVSADRVDVRYILDAAEIPTLQKSIADPRTEVARELKLTVDGRAVALTPGRETRSNPLGQGGLKTTRVELQLSAPVTNPRTVELVDSTYDGRVGWKAIVAVPGDGTAVRSSAPASDPTNGLRRYPEDLLESPQDLRSASFAVAPGAGTLDAPGAKTGGGDSAGGGFESILDGERVLLLLLVAAFGWGAVHALSPGHGKAMVAAYLVGTKGKPRDAVALGGIVTATHTVGVFALGLVTLGLSQYILPEDLFPYLNLFSGLLVVAVGAGVLRRHLKKRHHDHHHHGPGHHHHHHEHDRKGLLAMGAAAGLIPCPSALVVLLGAISQDQIALGMLLIVAFSLGLAATLTALGLAVVYARRLPLPGGVVSALPGVSAVAIVGVGCVLTANAIPTLA